MAQNGVKSTEIPEVAAVDDLLANSGGTTGRIPFDGLAQQLAATGAVAEHISGIDATTSDHEARLTEEEAKVALLETTQTSGLLQKATWAALSAVTGTVDAQGAEVLESDTGTHYAATATGYDGAEVDNAGRYSWVSAWSRWERVGNTGFASLNTFKGDVEGYLDVNGSSLALEEVTKDSAEYISEAVRPDGKRFISRLTSRFADVMKATVARLEVNAVSTLRPDGTTAATETASMAGEGYSIADSDGYAALSVGKYGGRVGMMKHQLVAAQRSRVCASGSWMVRAERRPGSSNHDLFAHDLDAGAIYRLTSDDSDTFDFADPAIISGDRVVFKRWTGDASMTFVTDLTGGDALPLYPSAGMLHALGDSFTGSLADGLRKLVDPVRVTEDGAGGQPFSAHLARFALTPEHWGKTLLYTEDTAPYSSAPEDLAEMSSYMQQTVDYLGQRSAFPRWIFPQPGVNMGTIGGDTADFDARMAYMRETFPNNVFDALTWMQASAGKPYMRTAQDMTDAGIGTTPADSEIRDDAYVADGAWPASCLADPGADAENTIDGHPSDKGGKFYAMFALSNLRDRGLINDDWLLDGVADEIEEHKTDTAVFEATL